MPEIAINVNLQQECYEVNISGTAAAFATFTNHLINLSTAVYSLDKSPNIYFPTQLDRLSVRLVDQSSGLISVQIDNEEFNIVGDEQAFMRFADFAESLQNLSPGEHFHLDWFANENLLSPTTSNMVFIFSMRAQNL